MATGWLSRALWLSALAAVAALAQGQGQGLSPGFYNATCPALQAVVRRGVARAVRREPRMGASILRLFFHDCFVNVKTLLAFSVSLLPRPKKGRQPRASLGALTLGGCAWLIVD